ncbi:DUF3426 domain-containing protein [Marinobacter fuscus]|uniref:DUF3426 domain-containing protein n=1 Tax=Marinobacter fuscus TaxID=2109942 RepID=A0A2T1KE23_9GAMM|nr:DUF3426 domain-containing protein [Marinobacter fuscus]PSF08288.1 DUF3426 domain-containing protein [Marinobacter fuscus]
MTRSSLQTQCPSCETRFRVTEEQLSIAKGKVRCGNCMKIFNAVDHEVASAKPADSPANHPRPDDSTNAGQFDDDEELIFADNPEEDASEGRYAGNKLTFSDDELSDSFRGIDETEGDSDQEEALKPEKQGVDESWAEAMLRDDDPAPASGARTAQDVPETKEPRQPEPTPATTAEPPATSEKAPEPAALAVERGQPEHFSLDIEQDRVGNPPVGSGKESSRPPVSDNLYHDLRRDPIAARAGNGRFRTFIWSLIVLALLAVVVAQVTWFQVDRLSAIPQLRPFYEQGCELLGCELKPLINLEAIESRKLVVRTDPENRNQLIVDAVILNRAAFEQPFPAIALTFSNLNGDVVAQSTFTPQEYLAGDGANLNSMPVETPVRIAIRIRDPGRDAVNYNLSFRPWQRQ